MKETKFISEQEAWQMLGQGATLVTVNRRLARYLTSCYTQHQLESSQIVWPTPDIIPFTTWLQRVYDQSVFAAYANDKTALTVLLTPTQELCVWETIIKQSAYGKKLLQVRQAAQTAVQAWGICMSWRLPMDEVRQYASEDTTAFLAWADQFQARCRKNGWLDNSHLGDAVAELFQSGLISLPKNLIFAGFDELTPQQESIINAGATLGANAYFLAPPSRNVARKRIAFADAESEMTGAANWARASLEENPDSRIGVIVPDLASRREKIIRIFDDVFHPAAVVSAKNPSNRIYNVSLGQPLSQYPVIRDALLFIGLACKKIALTAYSQWMLSPFWSGAESELTQRALLDAKIRKIGETDIPIGRFLETATSLSFCKDKAQESTPVLIDRMDRFVNISANRPDRQKPSFWAMDFTRMLDALGWPGDRTLESEEYQTVSAWRDSPHRFAEMDAVIHEQDMASAFSDFKQLLDETTFQPESGDMPVQIMGLLEPAGEQFDHLWIMGLNGENWPNAPHPNPLLPVQLQRRHRVPHASVEQEYEFSRHILEQLRASAGQVIVSYPVSDGETDLYPSPLIAGIPEHPNQNMQLRSSDPYWSLIQSSMPIETLEDKKGPEIKENSRVSGGTGILKAQADCPFSAFAKYRLNAERPETPVPGLNAAERGGIVHHALQHLWEILKSHQELIARDAGQLIPVVDEAVELAIAQQAKSKPGTFTERFAALEKERLKNLLIQWLELDKQRSPFTVVQREKKESCSISGMELHTIADRIDQLEDKSLVIVDYKTGDISDKSWFTERMAEPQLPLYATTIDAPVSGVLFAQVKKGSMKYSGIADNEMIAPGVKGIDAAVRHVPECKSIEEIFDYWREKLGILADEFRQGQAAVSPVSIHTSCRYCDFGPLCRIGDVAK